MTIEYSLDENDFLTYQLFVASKSPRIRKRRLRSQLLGLIVYAVLGGVTLLQDKLAPGIAFMSVGILWFFLYPLWVRYRYVQHYKGFIRENYQDRCGRPVRLELTDDFLLARDDSIETKMNSSELEAIEEIPSLILLKLKTGQSFILPKSKIAEIDPFKQHLQGLATRLRIPWHRDENWRWK